MKRLIAILFACFALAACATPPELKTLSVAQLSYFDSAIGAVRVQSEALIVAAETIKRQAETAIDVEVAKSQADVASALATTIPMLPEGDRAAAATRLLNAATGPVLASAESKARLQTRLDAIKARTAELQAAIVEMKEVQVALDAYLQSAQAGESVTNLLLGSPGVQGVLSDATAAMALVNARSAELLQLFQALGPVPVR